MSYQLGPITISGSTVIITGSLNATQNVESTSSWANNAVTASYALFAANGGGGGSSFPFTGSAIITGSLVVTGSTTSTSGFTGSLQGTASWANNALTASLAPNYVLTSTTSSMLAPYVLNSQTSSFVLNSQTSSMTVATASWSTNAVTSYTPISTTGSTIYSTSPSTGNGSPNNSIFLGGSAGGGATGASLSVFLGYLAGQLATNANEAVIIGPAAGLEAAKANNSVFLGSGAGYRAVSASYSIIIGSYAGWAGDTISGSIGTNNIVIGNYVTLPSRSRDSINIGGIIFGTGSYSSFGTLYSGSVMGRVGINRSNPQYNLDVSGSGNYSNGLTVTGSLSAPSITGSLQGTSSWATNFVSATDYVLNSATSSFVTNSQTSSFVTNNQTSSFVTNSQTSSFVQNSQTSSFVLNSQTSSMTVATASFVTASNVAGTVTSASYAANGGVTSINVAGSGISINQSTGNVTITSTGGSGGAGANITASFTNQPTWTFTHALGNRGVVVQTFDTGWNQIIPENITLTDANTATITFPTAESGFAIATLGGVTSIVNASSSISSSFASTASFINILNQNVIITGSVAIGTGSIGNGENNLLLGPAPAGGTGEGGQIALLATGGSYTLSSFIDNWQDQFRILRGPGATSNAGLMYMNLQSGNTQFVGAVTASGFNGLPNDYLYVTRNTDQTVGSNWISQDIIFNNSVVSKGISYNTGTGLASLTGGKVYRITARLAWSAAAAYLLEFSCYDSSNTQIGPTTQIVQSTNGSNNISDGALDFIYAPSSNTDIKIRTTANTTALSGEKIRGDLNTQLIIQQIA